MVWDFYSRLAESSLKTRTDSVQWRDCHPENWRSQFEGPYFFISNDAFDRTSNQRAAHTGSNPDSEKRLKYLVRK